MPNQVLYGFHSLRDVFDRRVDEVGVETVTTAIQRTVDEHNRQMNALTGLFVFPTTQFKVRYATPSLARLQPLNENGRARPIQVTGHYEVGLPLQRAGIAWGANFETRIKMTVGEANRVTSTLLLADLQWMRDHILAALFYDGAGGGGWTFEDEEHGDLQVMGLADGDSTVYHVQSGNDLGSTDDHYLAQAAAIADAADPFPIIHAELTEHPENEGEVLAIIPTGLKAAVQALAGYYPASDPNIDLGANAARLTGNLNVAVPGTIFGYHDSGVWLSEWANMPANYIAAVMTGGERPIAMREDTVPELRGFRQVATREDYPFWESQWFRKAGFGAWNRVGAVVYRIGNASYATPTGYDVPMP